MRFTSKEILRLLPQRAPFLLLDKVIECEPGKSAVGVKNVTIDEPCFNGHFPSEPIFPGALTIEAIAQTIAVMYSAEYLASSDSGADPASHVGYLVSANVKFLSPILPGDTMLIKVRHKLSAQNLRSAEAVVEVDGHIAAKGSLGISEKP